MDPLPQYGTYAFLPYTSSHPLPPEAPSLAIKYNSTYTYCGPLLSLSTVPPSLLSWLTQTTTSPLALLSRLIPLLAFLCDFLKQAGVQHYWLTLRATIPTKEYDVPRWHVDDSFLSSITTPQSDGERSKKWKQGWEGKKDKKADKGWKLCTTLLGPNTLFLQSSSNPSALKTVCETRSRENAKRDHVCSSIRCVGCFDAGEAVRRSLAIEFAGEEVVQAKYREVVFFRIGDEEGAVHSEPPCSVDRVFVNVVPGTEEDLRKLMKRYGMEFPRAWSLGLPGKSVQPDELAERTL